MEILITGSGAADGFPALFAESEVSRRARAAGGKDLRLRASALVDGAIRIDFGPDTLAQTHLLGLEARRWTDIVFTHTHDDHFAPKELQYMFPPFIPLNAAKPTIWGNQAALDGICAAFPEAEHLQKKLIRSFGTYQMGAYELTPVKAYHKLDEDSLNLILRRDGKTFLYASDTGVYQEETWQFLDGWALDCVVIECTEGLEPGDYWGHLSCEEVVSVISRMRDLGCVSDTTAVCTTHHAQTGLALHADLEAYLNPHGIDVGFDGKILRI